MDDKYDAPRFFAGAAQRIEKAFHDASDGAIDLKVVDRTREAPTHRPSSVLAGRHFAVDLHRELRIYAANPVDRPVDTIVALYGGFYHHFDRSYGMIFDVGFIPDAGELFLNDPALEGRPREGCAIFLGAIARDRQTDPGLLWDFFDQQTTFTSIHELGHVFNLPHVRPPVNYMSQSRRSRVFAPEFYEFIPDHCERLKRGQADLSVWPGGSVFGHAGLLDSPSPLSWSREASGIEDLFFEIGITRDHVRYFEPFELDLSVRVAGHSKAVYRVPDCFDPGYEIFRVFIEEPNGERRLYRSPRHYCPHDCYLSISAKTPFTRDISLFGESGGYAFRRAGTHRIWAELHLGRRGVLRSNAIEIDIERERGRSSKDEAVRAALTQKAAAALLYHRLDRSGGRGLKILSGLLDAHGDIASAAAIQYAVGRALLEPGRRFTKERRRRGALCFAQALEHGTSLSVRQTEIAKEIVRTQ